MLVCLLLEMAMAMIIGMERASQIVPSPPPLQSHLTIIAICQADPH